MSLTTGNNSIDSLVYSSWNSSAGRPVTLTYSFMNRVPSDATSDDAHGFAPMNAVQQAGVAQAMAAWAAVANITFVQTAGNGQIQLGTNDQGSQSSGYAYLPNGVDPTYLFTNNNSSAKYNFSFADGDFGIAVLIHELGHTLGLKHPGNYDSAGGDINGPFLPSATDNIDYTQMSYNLGSGFSLNHNYGVTPMLYDIQAIQYLYGANMSYHTGADTYTFAKDAALQCIWDAGGSDTFDFSACTDYSVINLNAGAFSSTAPGYNNISIAYNVTIEKAIAGVGGSTIYASSAGSIMQGNSGDDVFYQGAGNDTITSGGGADTVQFGRALSSYLLSGTPGALTVSGDGVDTLSGISQLKFGDAVVQLNNFSSVLGGSANNDVLVAGDGSQLITGGAGVDVVKFSGKVSDYALSAGAAGITITDKIGGGVDLLAGVERVQFGDGSALALDIDGSAGQLYRLFEALFKRTPDLQGMGFWLDARDGGHWLVEIASNFVNSAEFVQRYGANNSDLEFVTALYHNVLEREPDAPGMQFWLDAMHGGLPRAEVLVNFSESKEFIADMASVIPVGIPYTPWMG